MAENLYRKYHGLRRTRDNSEVEGWYFVIREGDPAGWDALEAYAASPDCPTQLATELREHVHRERLMQGLYDASWER